MYDDIVTKQMVVDALNRGDLDRDSRIFIEIEGFEPFFATTTEGGDNKVSMTANEDQRPQWAHEIMFSPTATDPEDTPVAYHENEWSEDYYVFYEMDIQDLGNAGPDLCLYSDGTIYYDNGYGLTPR